MPKAIAYPTDAKLYFNGIKKLVRFSKANDLTLRQTYTFVSKRALRRAHQLAHARKLKKATKEMRRLKTYLGRVFRDVLHQVHKDQDLRQQVAPVLCTLAQVLLQERGDQNIGHMKSDGKLGRNYLKGYLGDKLNALLCGIGHNMRLIINHLRLEPKFFNSDSLAQSRFV